MHNTLLILILCLCTSNLGFSQTPNYFEKNPTWHEYGYGGTSGGGFWTYTDSISTSGDTSINGYNYHIMSHTALGWSQWEKYVRQENQQLFYFDTIAQSDSLLVDYGLNVNDTLKGRSFNMYYPVVIQQVDSLLFNGDYYKRLFTDTTNNQRRYLIEGVGYFEEFGQNIFGGHFANVDFQIGVESVHHLCYGQYSAALYPSAFGEMCSLSHASLTSGTINNPELIYDPVSQLLFIDDNGIYEMIVYSINGQQIDASKQSPLSTVNIESGIYFVLVKGGNHQFSQRIYIQN